MYKISRGGDEALYIKNIKTFIVGAFVSNDLPSNKILYINKTKF
jgi:hypothetical protein